MLTPGSQTFQFNWSGAWTGHWYFACFPSGSEVQPGRWDTGSGCPLGIGSAWLPVQHLLGAAGVWDLLSWLHVLMCDMVSYPETGEHVSVMVTAREMAAATLTAPMMKLGRPEPYRLVKQR